MASEERSWGGSVFSPIVFPTYYSDGRSNIGADFDLKCADKNIPLGSDDTTLTTLRWYSWSWADKVPPPDGSEPMVFDEVSTSTQEET